MIKTKHNFFYSIIAFCTLLVSPSYADLLISLNVSETAMGDGSIRYSYTLINQPDSDLPVVNFALGIPVEAELQSITDPMGWGNAYQAQDLAVLWEARDISFAIQPGSNITFSFVSPLGPNLRDYSIAGYDGDSRFEQINGKISGPSVVLIPEPSSMIPLGTGLIALGGLTLYRRRRHPSS